MRSSDLLCSSRALRGIGPTAASQFHRSESRSIESGRTSLNHDEPLKEENHESNSSSTLSVPFAPRRTARRYFLTSAAAAMFAILSLGIAPAALADRDDDQGQHWVASWATSPAAYLVYVAPVPQNQALAPSPTRFTTANIQPDLAFPFPNANTTGANNQTIRSIVKPASGATRCGSGFPMSSATNR